MIYILGKECAYSYCEMDDIIVMTSTSIDKLLEYVYTKIPIYSLSDYEILIAEDGNDEYDIICLGRDSYDNFITYKPFIFNKKENEDEYKHVCCQLRAWCDAVKERDRKIKEEAEQKEREEKEAKERELYEKLKVKYGE